MRKGYLTVYLSLSLSLILSFILTMVEGARMHTVYMESECIADIGMNSVLAEFHRELLEQYDLLFVDMSYGTSRAAIENSSEHLRQYMQKNCIREEVGWFSPRDWLSLSADKAVLKEYSLASDYGGNIMRRQALEYMKGTSVEGMLAELIEQVDKVESLGFDTRDIAAERNQIQTQIDSIELPQTIDKNGQPQKIELNNPADPINASRSSFILSQVLEDDVTVSSAAIYSDNYLSHRNRRYGTGISPDFQQPTGITQDLLFDCYLFEKCGRYGKEMDKSLLKYQLEYIIAGKESDMQNLEKVVGRLLLWREVANVIYIFSDEAKCVQAELLALALSAVLLVPELVEPVKYSILFAWAYLESVQDVKCLLKGGKVPLMKVQGEWKTGVGDIVGFSGSVSRAESEERGLSYEDYLRIMLFMEDDTTKNLRAMDIMEMDIRLTPGNAYFCMDACFDSCVGDISITSAFGYRFDIQRRYGYY